MNTFAKGILASALALVTGAGAALAADLPTRKAPPAPYIAAPAPMNWTGFYLGVNGGFGGDAYRYPFDISQTGFLANGAVRALAAPDDPGINGSAKLNSSGFLGGVTAGFNWQFAPTWVAGFEGDLDFGSINGKLNLHANANNINLGGINSLDLNAGSTTHYIDTARLRLGYLVTPQMLVFATGGLAYGDTNSTIGASIGGGEGQSVDILGGPYSKSVTNLGWTAGAGVEYKITRNLSFKTEYLYADLGTKTLLSGSFGGGGEGESPVINYSLKVHTTDHMVRAGLNWTFN